MIKILVNSSFKCLRKYLDPTDLNEEEIVIKQNANDYQRTSCKFKQKLVKTWNSVLINAISVDIKIKGDK